MMINLYGDFTLEERVILMEEQNRREKKTLIAYALWYFLGAVGGHRFYLGKIKSGIVMACMFLIGIMILYAGLIVNSVSSTKMIDITVLDGSTAGLITAFLGLIILISLSIWWIVDAILLHGKVQIHNDKISMEIVAEIKRGRTENE